ncbi:MAG: DAK2 domain-containing protein [Clostridia bacterium]|nr:DAK2 domain-containing protein [Clostridia bacterium]
MSNDISTASARPSVIDGSLYTAMLRGGAAVLGAHKQEINDLNVFPIPDGDTGDNMLMTIRGGVRSARDTESLSDAAQAAADGMLLGARGNSGVILSQFFDGAAKGFSGLDTADTASLARAFSSGVKQAYAAVMTPAEGTILTVLREAAAAAGGADTLSGYFDTFLREADASLARTPDLLPVLKQAGVVDSGGAGLIRIAEGMAAVLRGCDPDSLSEDLPAGPEAASEDVDTDAFGPDSVLEFGYCTELLLRLQRSKCDPDAFDVSVITDYLDSIGGNSVVAFRTGSVVKLHVHTMTPHLVLSFCRRFGEFLTVKIENMSLQHSSLADSGTDSAAAQTGIGLVPGQPSAPRRALAVVAVAAGGGIKAELTRLGADHIVDGGQSMNPSAEAFLAAFEAVNADHILVLPDNGNVIMAARQAASLYRGVDVRVLETRTVGEGWAALAAAQDRSGGADAVLSAMSGALSGVVTACVSECVRESDFDGAVTHPGDHIGFIGKHILSVAGDRISAVCALADSPEAAGFRSVILFGGDGVSTEEEARVGAYLRSRFPDVRVLHGGQHVYSFMMILK